MNRVVILLSLAVITFGMTGCAQYDNEAMAGDAVDIPDEKPMAPVLTGPSPAPAASPGVQEGVQVQAKE